MHKRFPTRLILIFLSFVLTCLLLSVWARSDCRGLKTYLPVYWMDVTGAQVHIQGQAGLRDRNGRVCFLACPLSCFSLPAGFPSSRGLCPPVTVSHLAWVGCVPQFRCPSPSRCRGTWDPGFQEWAGGWLCFTGWSLLVHPAEIRMGGWLLCPGDGHEAAFLGRMQWLECSVTYLLTIFSYDGFIFL